ncbi:MAG: hypothetical protein JWO50_335 [Candidatus Kaiserbacteria bacterium]|nr:hypothetical protein [Candidatus Kaiserbacteria bacterium]
MNIVQTLQQALSQALGAHGVVVDKNSIQLDHPADMSHGDYATGIALQYAKQTGKAPKALADDIVTALGTIEGVSKIEVAGPGFINFTLSANAVAHTLLTALSYENWGVNVYQKGKNVLIEYTDPNPFKAFHIGHLMSNAIGESLSRIIENAGAHVTRANYQGDLGVHVACAIWGIQQLGIHPESADEFGRAYAHGATAYKENTDAKSEIDTINKKLYDRSDEGINNLYDTGRKESLAAFEKIYTMLGTTFDHYFFESEAAPVGKEIVLAHPQTFVESDGARIFKGEEYGLHTRVFINSQGLPTYEAKELGVTKLKQDLYPESDQFIVVTANEIAEYFKVLKKAMEIVFPEIAEKLLHVPHGFLRLPTGKMSSRTGDVITGESLLIALAEAARERASESRADDPAILAQQVAVGAIKYQILRQANGKDIIFDREKALSLEGDSGPYIQYAYARACAILTKAGESGVVAKLDESEAPIHLTRFIYRFPEITERTVENLAPHTIANYALLLAAEFNSWYAQVQVLDETPAAPHKVAIVAATAKTLERCLYLLGIPAPNKM